jgi:hypothetical protein
MHASEIAPGNPVRVSTAAGGLTTRMVSGQPFAQPSDVAVVLRVLYLIFNEGYCGRTT